MSKPFASKAFKQVSAALLALAIALLVCFQLLHAKHAKANAAASGSQHRASVKERPRSSHAVPLAFEPNQGQAESGIQYVGRGKGYNLYLTHSTAMMEVHRGRLDGEVARMIRDRRLGAAGTMRMLEQRRRTESNYSAVVQMQMINANPTPQLLASEQEPGKVNYLVGRDRSKWHSNVPLYGRVEYKEIYPGVDLAFHGVGGQFEFDYLVGPNADPEQIALKFEGAEKVRTTAQGDLVLGTAVGDIRLLKPVAYQGQGASRKLVEARFAVRGNRVSFDLGKYDRRAGVGHRSDDDLFHLFRWGSGGLRHFDRGRRKRK